MLKRLTFKCWSCDRPYGLTLNLAGKPKLSPECPYCRAVGIVELDPYRQDIVEPLKNDTAAESNLGSQYNFPDVLPTQRPPEEA
jgi:hypothetical protein